MELLTHDKIIQQAVDLVLKFCVTAESFIVLLPNIELTENLSHERKNQILRTIEWTLGSDEMPNLGLSVPQSYHHGLPTPTI